MLDCLDDCKSHLESNAVDKTKESISEGRCFLSRLVVGKQLLNAFSHAYRKSVDSHARL